MAEIESELTPTSMMAMVREWMTGTEYEEEYEQYLGEFFEDFASAVEFEPLEAISLLPTPIATIALMSSFEDFLTAQFETGPATCIDAFFDDHGDELSPWEKEFLTKFKTSIVSPYKVVGRVPGESVTFQDLLRDSEPFTVAEELQTVLLEEDDFVTTRIIEVQGKQWVGGAVMSFSPYLAEEFLGVMNEALQGELDELPEDNRSDPSFREAAIQSVFQLGAMAATQGWVINHIRVAEVHPYVGLTEDQLPRSVMASIPLLKPVRQIIDALDDLPFLERPLTNEIYWNWHLESRVEMEPIKALLWIIDNELVMENYDLPHMTEAVDLIKQALGDALGTPTIEEVSLEGEAVDNEFDLLAYEEEEEEETELAIEIPIEEL